MNRREFLKGMTVWGLVAAAGALPFITGPQRLRKAITNHTRDPEPLYSVPPDREFSSLNAAIAAAKNGEQIIVHPNGRFYITNSIRPKAYTTLNGVGVRGPIGKEIHYYPTSYRFNDEGEFERIIYGPAQKARWLSAHGIYETDLYNLKFENWYPGNSS